MYTRKRFQDAASGQNKKLQPSTRAPAFASTQSFRILEELLEEGVIDLNSTGNDVCTAVAQAWKDNFDEKYTELDHKQLTNAWYNHRRKLLALSNKNRDAKLPACKYQIMFV